MHAYDKDYLPETREHFSVMLDYAVRWCEVGLRDFYNRFLGSDIAIFIEQGHPRYLVGMSGTELAVRAVEQSGGMLPLKENYEYPWEDPSFLWAGKAICYYQWRSGIRFSSLDRNGLPIERIHNLFNPLHEADLEKFVEVADSLYQPAPCPFRSQRLAAGLTQEQLAGRSGVSLRMVRAYEQGSQNLARAEAITLLHLARSLHCSPDYLLEKY